MNSKAGREEISFPPAAEKLLSACATFALRLQPGDDASCLNLYRPTQPRVLGVPDALVKRGGFAWAVSAAKTPEEKANPWLLLEHSSDRNGSSVSPSDVVPVVMDDNTATYSLHLNGIGDTLEIRDGRGQPLRLQVVGLLKNSILQGVVLLSESNFLQHFPDVSGYRLFLVETNAQPVDQVRQVLTENLGDYGFNAERSVDRLASGCFQYPSIGVYTPAHGPSVAVSTQTSPISSTASSRPSSSRTVMRTCGSATPAPPWR